MKSTEKIWNVLEELQDAEDSEIREALGLEGVPTSLLRLGLAAVADAIPSDLDDCDAFLTQVGEFMLGLRSDPNEIAA